MTWREMLTEELVLRGLTLLDIKGATGLDEEDADGDRAKAWIRGFTAWTDDRVYFPAHYEGSECIESVPRHPTKEMTPPIGGG
tara:strand:- start:280 stop:528 length:249 start_codon:yes stop_codon:yes gene_type:complete